MSQSNSSSSISATSATIALCASYIKDYEASCGVGTDPSFARVPGESDDMRRTREAELHLNDLGKRRALQGPLVGDYHPPGTPVTQELLSITFMRYYRAVLLGTGELNLSRLADMSTH